MIALKSNRLITLRSEDKLQGRFHWIEQKRRSEVG